MNPQRLGNVAWAAWGVTGSLAAVDFLWAPARGWERLTLHALVILCGAMSVEIHRLDRIDRSDE